MAYVIVHIVFFLRLFFTEHGLSVDAKQTQSIDAEQLFFQRSMKTQTQIPIREFPPRD